MLKERSGIQTKGHVMKPITIRTPFLIGVITLAGAMTVQAELYLVHGNAAEAQYSPAWVSLVHMPHGLDGILMQNQSTYVNIPLSVTTDPTKYLRRVRVLFSAGPDVHVLTFALWDGGTLVKKRDGMWTGNIYLYMKAPDGYQVQHGLCLSLMLIAGNSPTLSDRRFVVNAAGA